MDQEPHQSLELLEGDLWHLQQRGNALGKHVVDGVVGPLAPLGEEDARQRLDPLAGVLQQHDDPGDLSLYADHVVQNQVR